MYVNVDVTPTGVVAIMFTVAANGNVNVSAIAPATNASVTANVNDHVAVPLTVTVAITVVCALAGAVATTNDTINTASMVATIMWVWRWCSHIRGLVPLYKIIPCQLLRALCCWRAGCLTNLGLVPTISGRLRPNSPGAKSGRP